MRTFLSILAVLTLSIGVLGWTGLGAVYADATGIVCQHVPGPECADADAGTIQSLAQTVTDVLFIIIAAVSVLVLIIAGLMYIVSAGNPETTKRAKNAILYALVGLAVAFFAQAIVRIILGLV